MLTNPTSQNYSDSTRESLSYVNDLIVAATNIGMYFTFVESKYMGQTEADIIRSYGYNVSEIRNDFGTYVTYKITWDEEGYLMNEVFSFLSDENGDYLLKD
jgi:hypothetical protein